MTPEILRHLVQAMKKGARMVLVERVLPNVRRSGRDMALHQEQQIRALDFLMFITFGEAGERLTRD